MHGPAMIEELAQVLSYEKLQPRVEQLNLSSADLGDHHLLDLQEYAGISIVRVREFLDQRFPSAVGARYEA